MKVEQLASFQAVGIKVQSTWNKLSKEMPIAWKKLFRHLPKIEHHQLPCVDISYELKENLYTQFVAVPVDEVHSYPDFMEVVTVPAMTALHHTHEGDITEIPNAFSEMYEYADNRDWDTNEFKLDFGYTPDGSESSHELYIRLIGELS
ncbi:MAG: GyrI-like domain-containing protein [Bacteroidota bacterium]